MISTINQDRLNDLATKLTEIEDTRKIDFKIILEAFVEQNLGICRFMCPYSVM